MHHRELSGRGVSVLNLRASTLATAYALARYLALYLMVSAFAQSNNTGRTCSHVSGRLAVSDRLQRIFWQRVLGTRRLNAPYWGHCRL